MATEKFLGSVGSKMGTIVIGGGSGFIGSALTLHLRKKGYQVIIVSRNPGPYTLTWNQLKEQGLPECKAVVNVAGLAVLSANRWNAAFKQSVWASRVKTTQSLADCIVKMSKKPQVFVSTSGVGYYKPSLTEEYTEDSRGGDYDFLSRMTTDWEAAAKLPPDVQTRQVVIRSGVVLAKNGGMIKKLYLPFYLGLGGPTGSGKQFLPWIHMEDSVGVFTHAIENPSVTGILNGVSPQIITNNDFTKAFAKSLKRPAIFPVPEWLFNFLYNEERAKLITQGQKVIPKRTLESGYKYKYPTITSACEDIVRSK